MIPKDFKPMLAGEVDLEKLQFPLLASAKLDGVRALRISSCFMSVNMKPIPNQNLQVRSMPDGMDGELIAGDPTAKDCYRVTMATVMAENVSAASVRYHVFDSFRQPATPYDARRPVNVDIPGVIVLRQYRVHSIEELVILETSMLTKGYEGLILRDLDGPYKFGRSTTNEGWMLKLKQFKDDEARVAGFIEQQQNNNVATRDALGRTARSSHKANMEGKNTLGALTVVWKKRMFAIGTGFTNEERLEIWQHKPLYLGRMLKFKYLEIGMKDLPRHPVFLGWRKD